MSSTALVRTLPALSRAAISRNFCKVGRPSRKGWCSPMSAQTRIRDLVLAKLAGRKIDVVGFIDELLDVASEVGEIRCTMAADRGLHFDIGGRDACAVDLDACRGKLR